MRKNSSSAIVFGLLPLSSAATLAARDATPVLPNHKTATYHFLLGPKPDRAGQADLRILVDAQSRFIDLDKEPTVEPFELSHFTFAYRYPDRMPVRRDQLALPGVIIASFGWEVPRSVRKRVDGTWLNYYSRYKVKRPDEFGINAAVGDDGIDTSILFYSIKEEVMIEFGRIFREPLRSCTLTAKLGPYLCEEMIFGAALLPHWRDLMKTSESLIVIKHQRTSKTVAPSVS